MARPKGQAGTIQQLDRTWRIGFGPRFDETQLKPLPPGSFYTEPAGRDHFAQTAADPVVVYITGYGPTDTTYTDPPAEAQAR